MPGCERPPFALPVLTAIKARRSGSLKSAILAPA